MRRWYLIHLCDSAERKKMNKKRLMSGSNKKENGKVVCRVAAQPCQIIDW